jgi:hypothetical protein
MAELYFSIRLYTLLLSKNTCGGSGENVCTVIAVLAVIAVFENR